MKKKKGPKQITRAELFARGWTEGTIKTYLPPPRAENRHNPGVGDYVIHLWNPQDVRRAERRVPVKAALAKTLAARRKRAETAEARRAKAEARAQAKRVEEAEAAEARLALFGEPLIVAIREISRAAHHYRDLAEAWFKSDQPGHFIKATDSRVEK